MIYRKDISVKALLVGGGMLIASVGLGQTWDEWFNQGKTQIKYLKKQIAELQLLIGDIEKGYQIVQQGLQTINDLKHGDFNLHNAYFSSLLQVNSAVGGSSTVADCDRLATLIQSTCSTLAAQLALPPTFSAEDQSYVRLVVQSLRTKTNGVMQELSTLLTNGTLSLHDEERQQRIEALHIELTHQYRFIRRFAAQLRVMGIQRTQEQAGAQSLQQFYSLP